MGGEHTHVGPEGRSFLSPYVGLIKWSAMISAIGWALIYRLSEEAARIPEFVYVNF